MTKHLSGLNSKQAEAALHKDGPLLIVAGAGAGKTKTITHRIVNLILEGVAGENILAVTFTNKAAKEMQEKILNEIEKHTTSQNSYPFISTFHSLGVHIIKENAESLGLTKYFSILDEQDSTRLIKESLRELGFDPKQHEPRKIKSIISKEKGQFTHLSDYKKRVSDPLSGTGHLGQVIAQVWTLYEKKKVAEQALDFDDLLLKSVKLLQDKVKIREKYQKKWHYIHIDEYQDTNEVQYLMSKLLSEDNKNICVVGDADQNIYSWRGANLKNILNFEKDYQNTKIILLEKNYRSTKNILEAANHVIKKNKYRPDKNLFTDNKEGEKIGIYEALDEADEADFIATKIIETWDKNTTEKQNISKQTLNEDVENFHSRSIDALSEIAILYRANFQSRILEEAMLRYNIPYQVLGIKFFERKEIKDTLAYLRAALNRESFSDIKRIINFPRRGIGKVTLAKIFSGEEDKLPIKKQLKVSGFYKLLEEIKEKIVTEKPSEVIKFVVKKSGLEEWLQNGTEEEKERLANIKELATLALKYDNMANLSEQIGIEKLLEDAALASDQDSLITNESQRNQKNGVKLMTIHASKGLEFKYIFITGLEDGLFPSERGKEVKTNEDKEEERRLFYVALTRAKQKIFLSFANFRTIFGSRAVNTPSEFISDIPADLLEQEQKEGGIKTIYI